MDDADVWARIESLYRSRFAEFERVARGVTSNREAALEAVQEGFADALRAAGSWEGRGPLEAWVWRCVVNRARKTRGRPAVEAPDGLEVGSGPGSDWALRARIAALPERQRLVVFLRYFADLGYREIAEALGIEVGTVAATLHAAHASLRSALTEERV